MSDLAARSAFSVAHKRILTSVLDEIIPRSDDGRFPGAGEAGVGDDVEAALGKMPELREMIAQGLTDLDDSARQRHGQPFAEIDREQKLALLNEQGFLLPLLFQAYIGYYRNPRVIQALGMEPRPPHPKGYEMGPDDFSVLDPVRRRSKSYRSASG